jgi:alpha-L-fucosidase
MGSTATLKEINPRSGSDIYMLGVKKPLPWTQLSNGDYLITLPKKLPGKYAWTLKIANP